MPIHFLLASAWANFEAARPVPVNLDGEPTEFTGRIPEK
jgi:hypothetical protein